MKTLTTLHEKIVQRERIELSGQSSTTIAFGLFIVFSIISCFIGYLILSSQGFSYAFFGVVAFSLTGMIYLLSIIWKIIGSAYIKGDMLIVKYLFGKFKVTELRSIRGIKTVKLLGLRLTSIRYKIDGSLHKVIIVGNANYLEDPKVIINSIRKVA